MKPAFVVLLWQLAVMGQSAAPATAPVTGVVRDTAGGVVVGAAVIVRAATGDRQGVTGPDGRFAIQVVQGGEIVVIVRASGFAEARQTVVSGAARENLSVVLSPATVLEAVTVTPTRGEQRVGDTAASVNVINRAEIRQSPAVVADDVLRRMPAFSLFRRTSSLSSHPTTQGVSLRGLGPSGVSRTLVLLDGVPFNDPFGGWVYWTRVPLEGTDRIELVDGSSSSLYGNFAMGGVINIVTAPAAKQTLDVRTQYGNRNSPKFDLSASDVWGKVGVSVDVSTFSTEGFPIVVDVNPAGVAERGAVDNNATVDFTNVNLKLVYDASDRARFFFRTGYFDEDRNNGKHSTIDGTPEANDTTWKAFSGGTRLILPDRSELTATVFVDSETFRSNFLAVPAATPPRSLGRMTLNQRVPTTGTRLDGAMVAHLRRPPCVLRRHRLALGRRRQRGGRARRHHRYAGGVEADLRRHTAERRRVPAGHLHAGSGRDLHGQRADRSVAELRRPQPRIEFSERDADCEQQSRRCPSAATPSRVRDLPRSIASRRSSGCGATSAGASVRRH